MNRKKKFRGIHFLLVLAVMGSLLAGCSGTPKDQEAGTAAKEGTGASTEPLEYTFYFATTNSPAFVEDANDVLGKEIQKKFNIKVKEVFYNQGMSTAERMNLFIAAGDIPDVVQIINDNTIIPSTGRYAELGEMIKQNCPNLLKYFPEEEWKSTLYNGKMYVYPGLFMDGSFPQFREDVYLAPNANWAGLWTTENILKKCGYSFTPLADISKKINSTQKPPTVDDYKITPAIATPDDLYKFLKKVKEVMPQVNGKDIIPLSLPYYLEPHFGAMYGLTGNWKYNPETKQVSQILGDDKAKDYWKFMNKLYNEGLLDKDFAIQKDEQLQEKGVQQRVAVSMMYQNYNAVNEAVKKADPGDSLRMIPLPQQPGTTYVGIDGVNKSTYKFYISKDFTDIPRLLRYFDWFNTAESAELMSFGPESAGLYEVKDGKKVFKSQELYNALLSNGQEYLKQNYFSKGFGANNGWRYSKTAACVPQPTFLGSYWKRSYPFSISATDVSYNRAYITNRGLDWKGYILPSVDETTKKITDYTTGELVQTQSVKLFAAKSDTEFDKAWEEIQKTVNEKLGYENAKKRMETEFKLKGVK